MVAHHAHADLCHRSRQPAGPLHRQRHLLDGGWRWIPTTGQGAYLALGPGSGSELGLDHWIRDRWGLKSAILVTRGTGFWHAVPCFPSVEDIWRIRPKLNEMKLLHMHAWVGSTAHIPFDTMVLRCQAAQNMLLPMAHDHWLRNECYRDWVDICLSDLSDLLGPIKTFKLMLLNTWPVASAGCICM